MFIRVLYNEIKRQAKHYACIAIVGPRQSGKTTLCREMFPEYSYFNLEDISIREQIALSPKHFLEQYALRGIIIDEAQNMPEIFSYVQVVSDLHPEYKFILTGSSNFSLMHRITQSLAGRAALLTLLPLSLVELGELKNNDTNTLLFNGGYPAVWGKEIPANDVYRNYYNTYVERDVRQLLNIKDVAKFQHFIRLCAGRVGSEFNASAISNEVGVSATTITEWISTLEASYVLFRLQPYYRNIGKRLVKTPKIYFYDTGLVCFLLGLGTPAQLALHPLRGSVFENAVIVELVKQRFNQGKESNIYFYRDKSQREIDVVQEFAEGLNAYEIKSAKAFHSDFFDNIDYLKSLLGDTIKRSAVIYDGELDSDNREQGIYNFRHFE